MPDYFPARHGARDVDYVNHCAVAMEPQFVPDAERIALEDSSLLEAGAEFYSSTLYRFGGV